MTSLSFACTKIMSPKKEYRILKETPSWHGMIITTIWKRVDKETETKDDLAPLKRQENSCSEVGSCRQAHRAASTIRLWTPYPLSLSPSAFRNRAGSPFLLKSCRTSSQRWRICRCPWPHCPPFAILIASRGQCITVACGHLHRAGMLRKKH